MGSWAAPFRFFAGSGTMNRSVGTPLVWSPAFRRSGPAKAVTPNGRFMESLLSFFRTHWDHEPIRTGACRICNMNLSMCWLRFMDSLHDLALAQKLQSFNESRLLHVRGRAFGTNT